MAEKQIYFKKPSSKFKVGGTDKIFKYDFRNHDLEGLRSRFVECDVNGKEIKATPKPAVKKTAKKSGGK